MVTTAELFGRAQQHHQAGQLFQAEQVYRRILLTNPDDATATHFLGILGHTTGHNDEAVVLLRRAIVLEPSNGLYHANLAVVLNAMGKTSEALASFTKALELDPGLSDAHNNLGNIYRGQGRLNEAVASYREALNRNPEHKLVHFNLGNALWELGKLDEALTAFQEATRVDPNNIDAYTNQGVVLRELGRYDEALACIDQALQKDSESSWAHWNRAQIRLLQGDLPAAWPEFEYRRVLPRFLSRHRDNPPWNGSSLEGKTILLYTEQSLGNSIQFIRYAPLVKERGGTVLFECQPALTRLLQGVAGVDRLLAQGDPLPLFDVQAPLLSLPGIFGTTLETIPAHLPYLKAEPERVERWRKELRPHGGFQVGIAWQGNQASPGDRYRSIRLAQFLPLSAVEGVRLVSLQKGPGTEQLAALSRDLRALDLGGRQDAGGAFLGTAAVMMCLDLVITSDMAVAHLAGALGVPVWTILPLAPDWRWLLERSDSPWYLSMRLFRQKQQGDWYEVFERVTAELRILVREHGKKK